MPFKKGDPNINRTQGPVAKDQIPKNVIISLIGKGKIDKGLKKDFENGVSYVRELVYHHVYGKPSNTNINQNEHKFPTELKVTFTGE
jgi:hypothetical protein